jgi:hypothetical protein
MENLNLSVFDTLDESNQWNRRENNCGERKEKDHQESQNW